MFYSNKNIISLKFEIWTDHSLYPMIAFKSTIDELEKINKI